MKVISCVVKMSIMVKRLAMLSERLSVMKQSLDVVNLALDIVGFRFEDIHMLAMASSSFLQKICNDNFSS